MKKIIILFLVTLILVGGAGHISAAGHNSDVITKENNSYLFSSNDFLTLLSENQDNKAFQQIKIHDEFSVKTMDLPVEANSEIIAYKLLLKYILNDFNLSLIYKLNYTQLQFLHQYSILCCQDKYLELHIQK